MVSGAVLVVGLAVTVADIPMAWPVWPLGCGVVLPLAVAYAAREGGPGTGGRSGIERRSNGHLTQVKETYVAGEMDEAEFERRVEVALEDDAAA